MKFLASLFGRNKKIDPGDGNPLLVRAMHEVALADTPANRKKLYEALLNSFLVIPVPELPPGLGPGLQTTAANTQIQLTAVLDARQCRVTPVFTDLEALRNWDPNTPSIGVPALELFRWATGTDIQEVVINPFDPIRKMVRPGGRVLRWEFELLSRGVIPEKAHEKAVEFNVQTGQEVMIGRPAQELSTAVQRGLRTLAASIAEIESLYLFQMAIPQGQEWSSQTMIGIQLCGPLSERQTSATVRRLGDGVQPSLGLGESLDFTVLRGDFGARVKGEAILIFKRSKT